MSFAIPKLEPEWVYLQEAAARVVEREPSLDVGQVRKTLCDAITYGRLRVQSDDDPNDALTWTAFRARQRGFIGSSFAETWRMWLERGAEISWEAGIIAVSFGDHAVPIRLPRVRLADVLDLFEVPEEKPASEEAEEVPAQSPTTKKLKVPEASLEAWYKDRVEKWPLEKNPPSEDDDWDAAIAHFTEFNVIRDQIRGVRTNLAPQAWRAHGRRPDFQDPNKLAEKLAKK